MTPSAAPVAAIAASPAAAASPAQTQQLQQLQMMLADAQRHNAALETTVANQQRTLVAQAGGSDVALQAAELNARLKDAELELARVRAQLDEQRFRNRVLLAMVTISEGDYIQLCDELAKDPRECNVAFSYIQRKYKEKTIPLNSQFAPHA